MSYQFIHVEDYSKVIAKKEVMAARENITKKQKGDL